MGSTAGVLYMYKVDVIYKETPSFETNCILGKTTKNNSKKNQTKQTEQKKNKGSIDNWNTIIEQS